MASVSKNIAPSPASKGSNSHKSLGIEGISYPLPSSKEEKDGEVSGLSGNDSNMDKAFESPVNISNQHKKAASPAAYVPPSRTSKKGYTVYLTPETAEELRETAHARQTTMTKLFEEAIEALLQKERPLIESIRAARQPK